MKRLLCKKNKWLLLSTMIPAGIIWITPEIEQTTGHHCCDIFIGFTPSASGILHLISYDHFIIVFCFISLFVLKLVYFAYCFSLHLKNVSHLKHQLLNEYLPVRILSPSRCCIIVYKKCMYNPQTTCKDYSESWVCICLFTDRASEVG